ncbi:MAG: pyrophosphatase [Cryomorphaceae bacterium BACL29 MAG-121220-bin8]|jgi:XTP/dITP diphosphohydrolase|nr:MAG: pyrophosphatase [Cryomorphaceae bacterium BACL29 MAG-121220-bin8]|tara:strand:- start:55258 stop:56025 length:768 start_codon:yes stop_codon:yes gene_type:complete
MNNKKIQLDSISQLIDLMDELREKCPWDQKQTFESLKSLTIEETFELADAISENKIDEIKNELGDLLLHIIFYSKIASETNLFDISDVAKSITKKLIFRHPHVYGDLKAVDENLVKNNWENLKLKEGKKSVLEGVPTALPSFIKSMRIQEKVSNVGFDWVNRNDVKNKIIEEFNELEEEVKSGNLKNIESGLGDLIFSIINYGKFLGVNPDNALEKTNKKFIKRFMKLENQLRNNRKTFSDVSNSELSDYWKKSK